MSQQIRPILSPSASRKTRAVTVPPNESGGVPATVTCSEGTVGVGACTAYPGSGKILEFDSAGTFTLRIFLAFDYTPTDTTLRVSKWSQAPNAAQTGRTFDQDLDMSGISPGDEVGEITVTATSTNRWFDLQEWGGGSDSICFRLEGNVITLMGI